MVVNGVTLARVVTGAQIKRCRPNDLPHSEAISGISARSNTMATSGYDVFACNTSDSKG